MAIIRCPYCHAIIDENDKYCNNCGTQLLFPEDDAVEEEIPGEKIVDVEEEEEEKDYDVHEPGKETTAVLDKDEEEDEEEERTGELVTGPVEEDKGAGIRELLEEGEADEDEDEEVESDKDETQEVVVVEEPGAGQAAAPPAPAEPVEAAEAKSPGSEEETRAYPVRTVEKDGPKDETVELPVALAESETVEAPAPAGGMALVTKPPALPAKMMAEEAAPPKDEGVAGHPPVPPTFDTRELEGIGRTVDLSKQRLDKMIEVMAEKQKEQAPEAAPAAPERTTGTLPPWADKIRGGDAAVEREDTRDSGRSFDKGTGAGPAPGPSKKVSGEEASEEEEVEIFPRRAKPDSGIGLPEGVTQADLPFGPGDEQAAEEEEAEEEEAGALEAEAFEKAVAPPEAARPRLDEIRPAARTEAPPEPAFGREAEPEEEIPRPPFNFSVFLKAKAFDFLFIGVFWLVALWVAARSMEATLFELLSVTSTPVLLLYAVYIGLYFFLFKFFLGETLGDRLFRERE
jgi:hypothetical protein